MAKSVIVYIKEQLGTGLSSFSKEWNPLSDKDKADLRSYAEEEMTALGIEFGPK